MRACLFYIVKTLKSKPHNYSRTYQIVKHMPLSFNKTVYHKSLIILETFRVYNIRTEWHFKNLPLCQNNTYYNILITTHLRTNRFINEYIYLIVIKYSNYIMYVRMYIWYENTLWCSVWCHVVIAYWETLIHIKSHLKNTFYISRYYLIKYFTHPSEFL